MNASHMSRLQGWLIIILLALVAASTTYLALDDAVIEPYRARVEQDNQDAIQRATKRLLERWQYQQQE